MLTLNDLVKSRLKLMLIVSIAGFVLVVFFMIVLDYSGEPLKTIQPELNEISTGSNGSKPLTLGGVIGFKPEGGEYKGRVKVQLSMDEPLKSSRGDVIASYICYTLDRTEPTRTNGSKYTLGKSISLSQERTFTLKARLISKVGIYEGEVFTREYTIRQPLTQDGASQQDKPPAVSTSTTTTQGSTGEDQFIDKSIQPLDSVTDFSLLDRQVQEGINEKLRSFLISGEGITGIIISGELKLLIAVSKAGKASLIDISGFNVEPEGKMNLFKSRLNNKIQNINFPVPTANGEQVNVEVWLNFKKIMLFSSMVIFEK